MTSAPSQLDQLEALLTAATKGPWELCDKGAYGDFDRQSRVVLGDIEPDLPWRIAVFQVSDGPTEEESNANAELAVAAVNRLPALLACARALERAEAALPVLRTMLAAVKLEKGVEVTDRLITAVAKALQMLESGG